jgi:two-component system sensor kinase FixL
MLDHGPGLPSDVARNLFQPFVASRKGGMGVGLSICSSIITSVGGRIWAEARSEGGTAFHFTLPIVSDQTV